MNQRIVEVSEDLARKVCKLGDNYQSSTFSLKKKEVDICFSNGICTVKVTFPLQLITETIEYVSNGVAIDTFYNTLDARSKKYHNVEEQEDEQEDETDTSSEEPETSSISSEPTKMNTEKSESKNKLKKLIKRSK